MPLAYYCFVRNDGMVAPSAVVFMSLLQSRANLNVVVSKKGKQLHLEIKERGVHFYVA